MRQWIGLVLCLLPLSGQTDQEWRSYLDAAARAAEEGEVSKALGHYQSARRLAQQFPEGDIRLLWTLNRILSYCLSDDDMCVYEGKERYWKEALEASAKVRPRSEEAADELWHLMNSARELGKYDDGLRLADEVVRIRSRELGAVHPKTVEVRQRAAWLHQYKKDGAAARRAFSEILGLLRESGAVRSVEYAQALDEYAYLHVQQENFREARARYEEALALRASLWGEEDQRTLSDLLLTAETVENWKDKAFAEELYRRLLSRTEGRSRSREHVAALRGLGALAAAGERLAEADGLYERAAAAGSAAESARALYEQAGVRRRRGKTREALAIAERSVELTPSNTPAGIRVKRQMQVVQLALAVGEDDRALRVFDAALPEAKQYGQEALERLSEALADRLTERGRFADAVTKMELCVAMHETLYTQASPQLPPKLTKLGDLYLRVGRNADANRVNARAMALTWSNLSQLVGPAKMAAVFGVLVAGAFVGVLVLSLLCYLVTRVSDRRVMELFLTTVGRSGAVVADGSGLAEGDGGCSVSGNGGGGSQGPPVLLRRRGKYAVFDPYRQPVVVGSHSRHLLFLGEGQGTEVYLQPFGV
ncbi:MAG: tetratricopeptide repeat protein [Bryobacteraceae bacterium]|nr:tetratricopeptide repeat protein [Bryobacteraceae bacterium]